MYNLGEQFQFNYELAIPNSENVIQGKFYRFTVLSERLIRIEYSNDGIFEDRPTNQVWYRNMPKVDFTFSDNHSTLVIQTRYFKLSYVKERAFEGTKVNPGANLKIELLNTNRYWYYHSPEVRNYGTPSLSLDNTEGRLKLSRGLYSIDGFASIDDSKSLIMSETGTIQKRDRDQVDTYVFMYNQDFESCLKDYYMITGAPALIPRYALGNWWSREKAYTEQEVEELINNFDYWDVPLSIFLFDKDWHIREYEKKLQNSGFSWNRDLILKPNRLVNFLHSKSIHIGLSVNPVEGIYPYEENFDYVLKYLPKDEHGIIPFTVFNPRYIDVYLKFLINPLDAMGIDFYWLDINEKYYPFALFLLSHYQFYNNLAAGGKRPILLTRNSGIAAHRYPVLYSGKTIVDWTTLKTITLHNVMETNMGVNFWAHNIGGFKDGTEDNELYTRFVQFAVFSPIVKFGSHAGKYYRREPWEWDYKTYEIAKRYLKLRHQLIPYLYSEAYKYHKYGKPLIIPLYYRYPEFYDDDYFKREYYLGSNFFIAPITTKKDYVMNRVIHKFYLPEGVWYDYVTGRKYLGKNTYISFFKDEDYPVFVSAGAIIPLVNAAREFNLNEVKPPENMEIQIFPGQSNSYELYEDDGQTELYKKGEYMRTLIDYNYMPNNHTVIIRSIEGKPNVIPDRRNYRICFRNTNESDEVIVYFNDKQIPFRKSFNKNRFVIEIDSVPTVGQLSINCKGSDIEIPAEQLLKQDYVSIISDLHITTALKETIDSIMFGNLPIDKKRIAIRKLASKGLEKKFISLFLKLVEYMDGPKRKK